MSISKISAFDELNNVSSLQERVAVSDKCETELLANASAVTFQKLRATARLPQTLDTKSTQSKELTKNAHSRKSIKNLVENVEFYQCSEKDLKVKHTKEATESTRIGKRGV